MPELVRHDVVQDDGEKISDVGTVPAPEPLFSGNFASSRIESISGFGKGDAQCGGDEFRSYRSMIALGNLVADQIGYLFYQIFVVE